MFVFIKLYRAFNLDYKIVIFFNGGGELDCKVYNILVI